MRILNLNNKNIMIYNDSMINTADDIADLMVKAKSNCNSNLIGLDATKLPSMFFDKTSGMIDTFSQKMTMNGIKMAIFGDFSAYNQTEVIKYVKEKKYDNIMFFVSSRPEAIKLLQEK